VHVDKRGSTKAIELLLQVLDDAPESLFTERLKARWLLNIAYMTLGGYPDDVPAEHRIPPEAFAAEEPFQRFADAAPALGINPFNLAGGAILDDFDRDGRLDIVTTTMELDGQIHYFHNDGDGSFTDRTSAAGLDGLTGGLNCNQADYDNDGNIDILVLRGAWLRRYGRHPNSLIRNNGDGTFTDVTAEAGLMFVNAPTQTGGWSDYDLDGDLDLYVGNETNPGEHYPSQLFRNNGDGTFTDVAAVARVTNDRHTKGVTWGDYDADGRPDLFVSNMFQANRLYHNEGDGRFRDVAAEVGVLGPEASFPAWFWDFDNDGALDLYVASYVSVTTATFADVLDLETDAETMALYRGDGRGGLTDVTVAMNLDRVSATMGANFGDLDGDGYHEIYLGTGTPQLDAVMPNLLFRNQRGTGFADVTTAADVGHLQKGHGIAMSDIDNDGDRDIYSQLGGRYPVDAFGNALFVNPGFGHRFLTIELVGRHANRSAIGARVHVVVREAGVERSIYSWVNSGGSFGANSLRREIGLGEATAIEHLEILWPGSSEPQLLQDVPLDRFVRIVEGESDVELLDVTPIALD